MPLPVLLSWWNLIYIVPFGLALLYLGLFVFTGITFGDADADVDADTDADMDADADMDGDATVHVEAHVEADADADADHDTEGPGSSLAHADAGGSAMLEHGHSFDSHSVDAPHASVLQMLLSLLGVGKIPLSLALMILMFCWGIAGFALNALLIKWLGATALVGAISMPITLILALTVTGVFAAVIAKIVPNESVRERRSDLVGKPGEAIYDINAEFGMAQVRGEAGDLFQVPCRTAAGTHIPKGARIILFDYDRATGVFHVAPFKA